MSLAVHEILSRTALQWLHAAVDAAGGSATSGTDDSSRAARELTLLVRGPDGIYWKEVRAPLTMSVARLKEHVVNELPRLRNVDIDTLALHVARDKAGDELGDALDAADTVGEGLSSLAGGTIRLVVKNATVSITRAALDIKYSRVIESFEKTDPAFARQLRDILQYMPPHRAAEVVLAPLEQKRTAAFVAWASRKFNMTDSDIAVTDLRDLFPELYAAYGGEGAEAEAKRAELVGLMNTAREGAGAFPRSRPIIDVLKLSCSGASSLEWSFTAEYEAKLLHSSNACSFVLQLRRVSDDDKDDDEDDGSSRDHWSRIDGGVSGVLQRLSDILRREIERDGKKSDVCVPRAAFGAASDGFSIVFLRMDVNTGDDRWQRPLIASRSRVLQLKHSVPGGDNIREITLLGAAVGAASAVEGEKSPSKVHAEDLPSWAVTEGTIQDAESTVSGGSAAGTSCPAGLFGLLLVLSSATALTGRLRPCRRLGVLPPPLTSNAECPYWLADPTRRCVAGGFARVYFVRGPGDEAFAWKTSANAEEVAQLEHERDVLLKLAPLSGGTIINCAATVKAELNEDGSRRICATSPAGCSVSDSVSALVLQPVGTVLYRWKPSEGDFKLGSALRTFVADMALALATAHGQHICHCDVRPANVIVTKEGRFVLIDWGLSADTGTSRAGIVGVDAFLHDELLLAAADDVRYAVHPRHDYAGLAYSAIALRYGGGKCPWLDSRLPPRELATARKKWLDDWQAKVNSGDGDDELRHWVSTLLDLTEATYLHELLGVQGSACKPPVTRGASLECALGRTVSSIRSLCVLNGTCLALRLGGAFPRRRMSRFACWMLSILAWSSVLVWFVGCVSRWKHSGLTQLAC